MPTRYSDPFTTRSSGGLVDTNVYAPDELLSGRDGVRQARDVRNGSGHRGADPEQWYYDLISQYKNETFYNELLNNPWLASKQAPYTPNALNEIAGALGFSDGSEEYYAGLRSNANQWLSDKLDQFRQEDYNSPVEQVKREAAAGLNPALSPGSISPGSAAENDQPSVAFPGFSSFDSGLPSLASLFMQIYSFASGIATDSLSMKSIQSDLAGKEIDNASKLPALVSDYISGHVSSPYRDKSGKWTYDDLSLKDLDDFVNSHFSSRHARNAFKKEVQSSFNSARSFISRYSTFKSAEDVMSGFTKSLSGNLSFGRSDSISEFEPMVILTQCLTDIQKDLEKLKLEYDKDLFEYKKGRLSLDKFKDDFEHKEIEHKSAVLDKLDPAKEAENINSGYVSGSMEHYASYYENKEKKIIHKNLSDAAEKLHKAASKNGHSAGAQAAEFAVRMLTSDEARKDLFNRIDEESNRRRNVNRRRRRGLSDYASGGSR